MSAGGATVSPLLEAAGLCRHFGGVKAVDGVSLTLEPGTVLGLIGPNGAGKSTLLNLMSGCERPTAGRLLIGGRDLTGARPWGFARAGVARTFQIGKPFRRLTVAENVTTGALYGPSRNGAAPPPGPGARRSWSGWASPTGPTPGWPSSRWRPCGAWSWPGRWPSSPGCCSSTS